MFQKYKDKGFKVLAFPANNFGDQEPGSNSEIKAFCTGKKVTFDLFAKVSVKGEDQCPLYRYLTKHPDKAIAGDVQWNFQKYLVGRDGTEFDLPVAYNDPQGKWEISATDLFTNAAAVAKLDVRGRP